jgi:hypothetical protein
LATWGDLQGFLAPMRRRRGAAGRPGAIGGVS